MRSLALRVWTLEDRVENVGGKLGAKLVAIAEELPQGSLAADVRHDGWRRRLASVFLGYGRD
jgi:hypothetical protein